MKRSIIAGVVGIGIALGMTSSAQASGDVYCGQVNGYDVDAYATSCQLARSAAVHWTEYSVWAPSRITGYRYGRYTSFRLYRSHRDMVTYVRGRSMIWISEA